VRAIIRGEIGREVFVLTSAKKILAALALLVAGTAAARGQDTGRVTVEELKRLAAQNAVVILDVRNGEIGAKIKGAAHVPYNDLTDRAGSLPRDREIVTYCA
jgi:hypothetical protein